MNIMHKILEKTDQFRMLICDIKCSNYIAETNPKSSMSWTQINSDTLVSSGSWTFVFLDTSNFLFCSVSSNCCMFIFRHFSWDNIYFLMLFCLPSSGLDGALSRKFDQTEENTFLANGWIWKLFMCLFCLSKGYLYFVGLWFFMTEECSGKDLPISLYLPTLLVEGIEAQRGVWMLHLEAAVDVVISQIKTWLEERDSLHGGVMPQSSCRSSIFGIHVEALGQHLLYLVFEAKEPNLCDNSKQKYAQLWENKTCLT